MPLKSPLSGQAILTNRVSMFRFYQRRRKALKTWEGIKELRLDEEETLRPVRGSKAEPQKLGGPWKGKPPKFKNLCWVDM